MKNKSKTLVILIFLILDMFLIQMLLVDCNTTLLALPIGLLVLLAVGFGWYSKSAMIEEER